MKYTFPERLAALQPFWGAWYLDALLGEGSYGQVYRIYREDYGERYEAALKWISLPMHQSEIDAMRAEGQSDEDIQRFYQERIQELQTEITLMSSLRGSSHIVSLEDHLILPRQNEIGYDILLRMELLTPLSERFAQGMTVKDVVRMGIELCDALTLCEKKKIIHRDIKPDNIFVNSFGDYKLGDFGVARLMNTQYANLSLRGTPLFMAPEIYRGGMSDISVDQYSLGLVMHKLLNAQQMPFAPAYDRILTHTERENAFAMRIKGMPIPAPLQGSPKLKEIVCRACSYQPKKRFPSPEAMRLELEKVLDDPTGADRLADIGYVRLNSIRSTMIPPDRKPTENKWNKRKRRLLGASCCVILMLAALIIVFLLTNAPASPEHLPPVLTASVSESAEMPQEMLSLQAAAETTVLTDVSAQEETEPPSAAANSSIPSAPSTASPSMLAEESTAVPTAEPTTTPTAEPTATPTVEPTATPTVEPTATPTAEPTATPTVEPTATPTAEPTATPTVEPTATPTAEPTATPTVTPVPSWHGYAVIIAESVPVYADVYDDAPACTLPFGTVVQVAGQQYENDQRWHIVFLDGGWGYAPEQTLRQMSPAEVEAYQVSLLPTPTPEPTATPTPVPTPEPTPTPEPRVFEITSISADRDALSISWTDSFHQGPYTLCYAYLANEDYSSAEQQRMLIWEAGSCADDTGSIPLSQLVPGAPYWILLRDREANETAMPYIPPRAEDFSDFTPPNITLTPRISRADGSGGEPSAHDASTMMDTLSHDYYGLFIFMRHMLLRTTRVYPTHFVIEDPYGIPLVTDYEATTLTEGTQTRYWRFYRLNWYFEQLIRQYGTIPVGTYTLSLYFNSQYVCSNTFMVSD